MGVAWAVAAEGDLAASLAWTIRRCHLQSIGDDAWRRVRLERENQPTHYVGGFG